MPRVTYVPKNFADSTLRVIRQADAICREYADQGYDLTLRQLYYQFVARDLLPNRQSEYKRLGSIVNDARLAGLIDWHYIVDRTRNLQSLAHWNDPADIVQSAARSFRLDKWADQPERVEVWIEKDALAGVIENVCQRNDVDFFSCRGYTSQSEVWGAAQRIGAYIEEGQAVTILHLGDHDPSGLDMTRDIRERLVSFTTQDFLNRHGSRIWPGDDTVLVSQILQAMSERCGQPALTVDRIALNADQIEEYNPPPNPAKLTDSRAPSYVAEHGYDSWELDALNPDVLDELIDEAIQDRRDADLWLEAEDAEERERLVLSMASSRWDDVADYLNGGPK